MEDSEKIIVEFIKLSKHRQNVLKSLKNETLKPTDISIKTGIHRNSVSRTLSQLKEKDLVKLLNPESKRGRLYELTEYGEKILDLLES